MIDLSDERAFRTSAMIFLANIFDDLKSCNIDIKNWSIDHICYRVESFKRYEESKNEVAKISTLLTETEVNGRPISSFKLHHPLFFEGRVIDILELPAPKDGKAVLEGFEHIEIVSHEPLLEIAAHHPNLKFDTSGLKKNLNKELKLKLGEFQVKFHYQSLESIINLEKNELVYHSILQSQTLDELNDFDPVIAGSFPLNIHTNTSDLNILINHDDTDALKDRIRKQFGTIKGFEDLVKEIDGIQTYTVRFDIGVWVEIISQKVSSVKQTAFQHFQIEEQILHMASSYLIDSIRKLIESGFKTEEAFTKILNLGGDPYKSLLTFGGLTDRELYERLKGLNPEYVRNLTFI